VERYSSKVTAIELPVTVLDNDGALEELEAATHAAWRTIRQRAAAKLLDGPGVFLAVATDQREAVRAFGGTMARYADAGAETWLACIAPGASEQGAEALGLHGTLLLRAPGQDAGDEPAVTAAVERVIRQRRPDVTVTIGPGDGTQATLYHTARSAWSAAGSPGMLFCSTPSRAGPSIHAQLDVRPWRDVRAAALDALGAAEDAATTPLVERELFTAAVPPKQLLVDLFHAVDRAG